MKSNRKPRVGPLDTVPAVYMPVSGSCRFTIYVAIKKRVPGEGKSAGMAALSANPNIKMAIVVDDDIDIYNEQQVLWAIATHFEAPVGEHSDKPEKFYEIVRKASYPSYGEAFQRTERPDFRNLFEEQAAA